MSDTPPPEMTPQLRRVLDAIAHEFPGDPTPEQLLEALPELAQLPVDDPDFEERVRSHVRASISTSIGTAEGPVRIGSVGGEAPEFPEPEPQPESEPEAPEGIAEITEDTSILDIDSATYRSERREIDDLVRLYETSKDPLALHRLVAMFNDESLDIEIRKYAQDAMARASASATDFEPYVPYYEQQGANIGQLPEGDWDLEVLKAYERRAAEIKDMDARQRYERLMEDLGFFMSYDEETFPGFGPEAGTPEEALVGGTDPVSGEWRPGFLQEDFRYGDVRNQRGLLPGMSLDKRTRNEKLGRHLGVEIGTLMEDMSPRDLHNLLVDMSVNDPTTYRRFQRAWDDAGLYGESRPVFGLMTGSEFDIMLQLRDLSLFHKGKKSMIDIMDELTKANMVGLGESSGVINTDQASQRVGTLTSKDALTRMANELGLAGAGRRPSEDTINRAIEAVHAAERRFHTERFAGEDLNAGLGLDANPDRGRVIEAMGGVGAFSPANWTRWSTAAFGGVVEQNEANREVVAHVMLQTYHDRYGNWPDAVAAVNAGPESQAFINLKWDMAKSLYGSNPRTGLPQRMPTDEEYLDMIMGRFSKMTADEMAELARGSGGGVKFVEAPDADAIVNKELRAADEVGFQSWEFAGTASQFYNMLGSLY